MLQPGPLTLDTPDTLHIRCGSDIQPKLRKAGFIGEFLELSDPVCMGPVPNTPDLPDIRARYIAETFGQPLSHVTATETLAQTRLAFAKRAGHPILLWFEHDSYDQFVLARTLSTLAARQNVHLICIDNHPRPPRFIGLGQLLPEDLRALHPTRTLVDPAQYAAATAIWNALRAPTPEPLAQIAAAEPSFPFMPNAIRRHLQELPWTTDGLSLSERLALQAIAAGAGTAGEIFAPAQAQDPLPYLGDLMQWAILKTLAAAPNPPLTIGEAERWPKRPVALTPLGHDILAGRTDWQTQSPPERWVGGIRLPTPWRWDAVKAAPIA